jgi:hypothetical protein
MTTLNLAQDVKRSIRGDVDSDLGIANIALEFLGDGLLQFGLGEARGLKGAGERERYRSGIVDLVVARKPVLAENRNAKFVAGSQAELSRFGCRAGREVWIDDPVAGAD